MRSGTRGQETRACGLIWSYARGHSRTSLCSKAVFVSEGPRRVKESTRVLMNPPFIEPPTVPLPARLEVRVLSAQPIVIDGRSNFSIDLEVTNVGDVPAAECRLDLVGLPGYLGRPTSKDLVIGDVEAGASLQKTVVFQVAWEAEGESWVVLWVVWKDGSSGSVKVRVLP